MVVLQIAETDRGLAVLLSGDSARVLGVQSGDALQLCQSASGEFALQRINPQVAEEIMIGTALMGDYDNTLKALAK